MTNENETRLTRLETQREADFALLKNLSDAVFGNGKPGLKQEMTIMDQRLGNFESTKRDKLVLAAAFVAVLGNIACSIIAVLNS